MIFTYPDKTIEYWPVEKELVKKYAKEGWKLILKTSGEMLDAVVKRGGLRDSGGSS